MKNTFAVTMTLLLALALGGSFAGYRIATTPHEATEAHKGGAESIGDPTVQDVKSESVPSAREAATQGSNDLSTAQGNVMEQDQGGGAKAGENGAVAAEGGQESGGASGDAGTTSNQNGSTTTGGGTTPTQTGSGTGNSGTGSGGTGRTGGGANDAGGGQTGGDQSGGTSGSGGTGSGGSGSGGTGGNSTGSGGSETDAGDAADSTTATGSTTDGGGAEGRDADGGDVERGGDEPDVVSPSSGGIEGTQVGQTGSSNTEKATASSPGISDSKAAEVASVLSGDTGEGQKKYVASCSGCHGGNGEGGAVGPALNGAKGPGTWDVAEFEAAVRQGHAPDRDLGAVMPRFTEKQLSDEDLTDIYAYLKTLRQ